MTLYLIGLGLNDEKDITIKGLEAIKNCEHIYLECYTSLLQCTVEDLETLYGKKIIKADRELVEKKAEETILKHAKEANTAFLVIGDPLGATTHMDILTRAKELGIKTEIIHNTSILTAVGETGLQLYKFGKTTSIPFFKEGWATPYTVLEQNKKQGLHTLFLLDLDPLANKFMSIKEALDILLQTETKEKKGIITPFTQIIACARLGGDSEIKVGAAADFLKKDFGKPPYCLIVPGSLHFMEEEILKKF